MVVLLFLHLTTGLTSADSRQSLEEACGGLGFTSRGRGAGAEPLPAQLSGLWYVRIRSHLANVFFSIPIRKEGRKQLTPTWERQRYSFTVLHNRAMATVSLCQNIIPGDRDCLDPTEHNLDP